MTAAVRVAAFVGALWLAATPARAQLPPRTMRLEVARAPGAEQCPDAAAVNDAIAVAAGVDPFDPTADARLVVTLNQGGAIARGRWQLFGADGALVRERAVTITGSCRQLLNELALTFVIFYETPPPAPPPAPEPCPPAPPPVCDAACRNEVRDEVRRELLSKYGRLMDVHAVVMAGGLLSANLTADPGGGFWIGGEAHGEIFSAGLEAHVLMPSRAVVASSLHRFEISAVTASLVPCARWEVVLGCVVIDFGMLIAGGQIGLPPGGSPVIATLGIGPRLAAQVPITERFGIRAFADLRFAPVPSQYEFVDSGGKWESNIVSGLFGLGITFE